MSGNRLQGATGSPHRQRVSRQENRRYPDSMLWNRRTARISEIPRLQADARSAPASPPLHETPHESPRETPLFSPTPTRVSRHNIMDNWEIPAEKADEEPAWATRRNAQRRATSPPKWQLAHVNYYAPQGSPTRAPSLAPAPAPAPRRPPNTADVIYDYGTYVPHYILPESPSPPPPPTRLVPLEEARRHGRWPVDYHPQNARQGEWTSQLAQDGRPPARRAPDPMPMPAPVPASTTATSCKCSLFEHSIWSPGLETSRSWVPSGTWTHSPIGTPRYTTDRAPDNDRLAMSPTATAPQHRLLRLQPVASSPTAQRRRRRN